MKNLGHSEVKELTKGHTRCKSTAASKLSCFPWTMAPGGTVPHGPAPLVATEGQRAGDPLYTSLQSECKSFLTSLLIHALTPPSTAWVGPSYSLTLPVFQVMVMCRVLLAEWEPVISLLLAWGTHIGSSEFPSTMQRFCLLLESSLSLLHAGKHHPPYEGSLLNGSIHSFQTCRYHSPAQSLSSWNHLPIENH